MNGKPRKMKLASLPETCGSCRHGHDISGQTYLLCQGLPPIPISNADGEVDWQRGGPVEPEDASCAFYALKNRA